MSSARASICSARLELDPERRRRAGVARCAALGDHALHLGEGYGSARRRRGGLGPEPDGDPDDADGCDHRDPPRASARVPLVEEDADERGQHGDENEHEPCLVRAEGERSVARQHREEDRERQVVVVDRAVLGLEQRGGVRLALLLHRVHELSVRGDDHEQDVRRHDRPDHRADLEVRGAGREELTGTPGGEREQGDADDDERHLASLAYGAAEHVVDEPGEDDAADADERPPATRRGLRPAGRRA